MNCFAERASTRLELLRETGPAIRILTEWEIYHGLSIVLLTGLQRNQTFVALHASGESLAPVHVDPGSAPLF